MQGINYHYQQIAGHTTRGSLPVGLLVTELP